MEYDNIQNSDLGKFLEKDKTISVRFIEVIYKMTQKLWDFRKIEKSEKIKINKVINLLKEKRIKNSNELIGIIEEIPYIKEVFWGVVIPNLEPQPSYVRIEEQNPKSLLELDADDVKLIAKRLNVIKQFNYVSTNSFSEVFYAHPYLFVKTKSGQKSNLFNSINLYIFFLYYHYLPALGFKGKELKNMLVAILMYHPKWYEDLNSKEIIYTNIFLLSYLKKKSSNSLWNIKANKENMDIKKKINKEINNYKSKYYITITTAEVDKTEKTADKLYNRLITNTTWLVDNLPAKNYIKKVDKKYEDYCKERIKKNKEIQKKAGINSGTFISSEKSGYFFEKCNIKENRLLRVMDKLRITNFNNPPVENEISIDTEDGFHSLPLRDTSNTFIDKETIPYIENKYIIWGYCTRITQTVDFYKLCVESGNLNKEKYVEWFDNQASRIENELLLSDTAKIYNK